MLTSLLSRITARTCLRCGETSWQAICSPCRHLPASHFCTPRGHSVRALGLYDGPTGNYIRRLKYQEETIWATYLGSALGGIFPDEWRGALLLPVPLHPERLASRGYNQAALLARALARAALLSVNYDWLSRIRHTQAQAQLGRIERNENLKQGFACGKVEPSRPVVLVDDVVTTGSTLDACIEILVASGATVRGAIACAVARETPIHIDRKGINVPPTRTQ